MVRVAVIRQTLRQTFQAAGVTQTRLDFFFSRKAIIRFSLSHKKGPSYSSLKLFDKAKYSIGTSSSMKNWEC
jgi:hypothetical protein